MLYIVARSAQENRPSGISLDDMEDVGFAMYPSVVGKGIADNANVPSGLANVVAGQYFWKGGAAIFLRGQNPRRILAGVGDH
jgi:hypothetical protein